MTLSVFPPGVLDGEDNIAVAHVRNSERQRLLAQFERAGGLKSLRTKAHVRLGLLVGCRLHVVESICLRSVSVDAVGRHGLSSV